MGASHSRYGRCMPGSNSNQSVIPRLEAKPPSVNLQGGQGESSSAVTTAGPAGNSELGDAANVFVVDSGEDTSNEYLTILDDETGLTLQDAHDISCSLPKKYHKQASLSCSLLKVQQAAQINFPPCGYQFYE
uniref:Uncharacterized protein n=1 Tax=Lygus hesperus TaxID=30085 RepID=A0A146KX33_LYGHE